MTMDYNQVFAISAAGMTLERTRVEVAALNLANANTIQTPNGVNYQPLQVVARSSQRGMPFDALVAQGLQGSAQPASLPVVSLEPVNAQPRMVYEPGHPLANERGFVAYAGVDTATQMVTMMSATRAYEANVAAMNTARTLALKALDIGGAN
jgi:flagellar basal-body rod protein FlgC